MNTELNLNGFSFQALFTPTGLADLDQAFLDFLYSQDKEACSRLQRYRQDETLSATEVSDLLIRCAAVLEIFLSDLFDIEKAVAQLQAATLIDDPIFAFKKYFVLREARRNLKKEIHTDFATLDQWLSQQLFKNKWDENDRELAVAQYGQQLLNDATTNQPDIDKLVAWCVLAMTSEAGRAAVKNWVSFHLPKKLNYANLVDVEGVPEDRFGRLQCPPHRPCAPCFGPMQR